MNTLKTILFWIVCALAAGLVIFLCVRIYQNRARISAAFGRFNKKRIQFLVRNHKKLFYVYAGLMAGVFGLGLTVQQAGRDSKENGPAGPLMVFPKVGLDSGGNSIVQYGTNNRERHSLRECQAEELRIASVSIFAISVMFLVMLSYRFRWYEQRKYDRTLQARKTRKQQAAATAATAGGTP